MIRFEDFKRALEALPYGIKDVTENTRLVEDCDLDPEDAEQVFSFLQMQLQCEFPDDDAFYRFAVHMPLKDIVEVCNTEVSNPLE